MLISMHVCGIIAAVINMLIESVIQKEAQRNLQMIRQYEDLIAQLPKGSLICRKREYYYLKYRQDGKLCGVLTDRDMVTRCLAAGRLPENTKVREIMTAKVIAATPDMDTAVAAHLMGRQQIRRLPVVENGRLCGMISLGDLAVQKESSLDAGDALSGISSGLLSRK